MDIDPQTVCGYNPCLVAKCILLPYATCVSDFKCRPVFFDSEERKVSQCTGNFCVACYFFCFSSSMQKETSPNVGLEPTTLRLRVSCSTDWASRALLDSSLNGFQVKPMYLQSVISQNISYRLQVDDTKIKRKVSPFFLPLSFFIFLSLPSCLYFFPFAWLGEGLKV